VCYKPFILMSYLLECPRCEAVMGVTVKGDTVERDEEGDGPWKVTLAACPKCHGTLLGVQESNWVDEGWDTPVRVWPSPPLSLNSKIPKAIRDSLEEAHKCLKAKAFTASVVMSGRALEAIGKHFYPSTKERKRPMMLKEVERRKGGWTFEDTKRERSRRMIKLQNWIVARSVLSDRRAEGRNLRK
jgi:hypothetical protein